MIYLPVKLSNIKPAQVSAIAGSLKQGQVVVLPTDTVYGFSCLAADVTAIKKIYRLKKRDTHKPSIVLMPDLKMVKKYARVSVKQESLLKKIWQNSEPPTTVILKKRSKLPAEITGLSDGLAIRLPKLLFLIKILKVVGQPLVSTSLNLSGQPEILSVKNLTKYFPRKNNQPDLVIDAGPSKKRRPSRLIDLRFAEQPIILR